MSLQGEEKGSIFTDKELITVIYDIRDRVTRIEEKQNRIDKIEEKSEIAESKATEALILARDNRRDIDNAVISNRWVWGTVITIVLTVIGYACNII